MSVPFLPRPLARLGGALALFGGLACAAPLQAADLAAPAPVPAPAPAVKTGDTPVFIATAYLWGSALSGTTSTLPPLPATNIDMSFGDILGHLDGAIMAAGEMRVGRWSVLADVMFTQVTPSGNLPGPLGAGVEVRSRSLTLQGDVLYRLYESQTVDFDAGVGLRYWNLNNRLTIDPGPFPASFSYSQSENWIDPVVAGRIQARLGGPWSLTFVGDVGGFDVGSQFTWQAIGTVNYRWNDNLSLRAGYRALGVDYQKGSFEYDVVMQGPILGASYRF